MIPKLLAVWLVAAALLVIKSPDALSRPQFWAEDGAVFFAEQLRSAWPLLFEPYAGYLNCIPRLVAWIGGVLPVQDRPLLYNATALAIDSFSIAYVTLRARFGVRMPSVFLAFFVVPTAGDIFGTITNAQWFLQFAIFVACIREEDVPHEGRFAIRRIASAVLLLMAALSGPFALLWVLGLGTSLVVWLLLRRQVTSLAPSEIVRHVSSINFIRWDRFAILGVGAAIQLLVMSGQTVKTPELAYVLPWQQLAELGVARQLHPYIRIIQFPTWPTHLALLCFYVACLGLALALALKRRDAQSLLLGTLMCVGCLQPLMAFAKQQATHTLSSPSHYFYLWGVGSIWVLAGFLETKFAFRPWINPLGLGTVLLVGLLTWPDYFRRAPLVDLNWPAHAQMISEGVSAAVVPLNPLPWHMVIEPAQARRAASP